MYHVNDVVSNDGSSYICISEHEPTAATEPGVGASWSTYWEVVALAGTSGTSGSSGASGSSGTSGAAGTSGTSGAAGTSGTSGTSGTNGSSGTSGWTTVPIGLLQGLVCSRKDDDEIYVSGGSIEINEVVYNSDEQLSCGAGGAVSGYTADQCTGGTASASSIVSAGYNADKAVDDDGSETSWYPSTSDGAWWQYQFATAKNIRKLVIRNANNSYRMTAFTLKASATGAWAGEEVTLTSGTGLASNQTYTYTFENASSYTYYRIYVDAYVDGIFLRDVQMCEPIFGFSPSTPYYVYVDTPSSGTEISANELSIVGNAPNFVSAKGGWYHPSYADQRAIATFTADSNGYVPTSGFSAYGAVVGASGTSGTSGNSGTSGTSGNSGTSGSSGVSGSSGTSGVAGAAGTSGTSGNSGTSGTSGATGAKGDTGNTGAAGTSGTSGVNGAAGTSGTSGNSGTSGTSGVNGAAGTSGTSGNSGTSGTSGVNGAAGTSGTSGNSGTSGTSGVKGDTGNTGAAGTSGTSGATGAKGDTGNTGAAGSSGTSGTSGATGSTGASGTSGTSGNSGTSGTSGVAGASGTSGTSGVSGTSGTSGGGLLAIGADHSASGPTVSLTAGTALAMGNVCYMGSDGKMELADADGVATAFAWAMAMATINENSAGIFALPGCLVQDVTWNWTSIGQPVYLDTATSGGMTQTAPTGTNDVVQIIGIAITADAILFYPQLVQVEIK